MLLREGWSPRRVRLEVGLRLAANGAERIALLGGYLARIGAPAALQIEVLPDGVVELPHRAGSYSALPTPTGATRPRTVRFLPVRLAS